MIRVREWDVFTPIEVYIRLWLKLPILALSSHILAQLYNNIRFIF